MNSITETQRKQRYNKKHYNRFTVQLHRKGQDAYIYADMMASGKTLSRYVHDALEQFSNKNVTADTAMSAVTDCAETNKQHPTKDTTFASLQAHNSTGAREKATEVFQNCRMYYAYDDVDGWIDYCDDNEISMYAAEVIWDTVSNEDAVLKHMLGGDSND